MSAQVPGSVSTLTLEDAFAIAKNPELFEKRIKELNDCTERALEATKQLTKAKDLDSALNNAKRAEQRAGEVLSEARAKAAQEISNAELAAETIVEKARAEVAGVSEELKVRQHRLDGVTAELNLANQQLHDAKDKLSEVNQSIVARRAERQALAEEIENKRQAFASLLAP